MLLRNFEQGIPVNIEETKFSNGLTVVTADLPGFETAGVAAIVGTGANAETDAENGLAHFLEHMAFKGTAQRTALDISREIEILGSNINAMTSRETTSYYVTGLAKHMPSAVAIIGDVLTNSLLQPQDIEKERGVIQQEIKQYDDDPFSICSDRLDSLNYPGQPLGRTILGTQETVSALDRTHFKSFMDRFYTPGNTRVFAAGKVNHAEVVRTVEAAFADYNGPDTGRPEIVTAYQGGVSVERSKPFEQVSVYMALEGFGDRDERRLMFEMFGRVLGGGMSSPLFQEVREKRGLVYAVGAYPETRRDAGRFIIYAGTTAEHVEELIRVSATEIIRIANDGPTEQDFERARNSMLNALATVKEKPLATMFSLARWYALEGRIVSPDDMIAQVERITRDDIRLMASTVLQTAPSLSLVGPAVEMDYGALLVDALRT